MSYTPEYSLTEDDYPHWFVGKQLKARDFIAFEKYLFSRFRYPGRGFGVISYDLTNDLQISIAANPGFLTLVLRDLKGITSAGHLVELDMEGLKGRIKVSDDKLNIFDLEVVVDSQQENITQQQLLDGYKPNKYKVRGTLCDDEAEKYKNKENALYLGRYAFKVGYSSGQTSTETKLLQYPAVYTLASIKFFNNEEWVKWTDALSDRLEAVINSLQTRAFNLFTYARSVALTEAYWLAYHWSSLPVPHLKEQLQYLNWLLEIANSKRTIDAKGVSQLDSSKIEIDTDVNALPQRLAGLIGSKIVVVGDDNKLIKGTNYDLQWDFSNLILTFKDKYPPSIFQTMLYFGEGVVHDCLEKVRVDVRDSTGRRKLSPEVLWIPQRDNVKNKVIYIINVGKPLEEGDTMILYNVSSKEPKPGEVIRRKSIPGVSQ